MAPKKREAATNAPASKKVAAQRLPGSRKADEPTRAEKKKLNKAAHHIQQKEVFAELRMLTPPAVSKVIQPLVGARPTVYTDELGERVCLAFATDPAFSLLKLNADPTLPTIWWFYKWLIEHPHFEKAYACARDIQSDLQAAELEEWSSQPLIGKKTVRRVKTSDNGDEETEETQEYDNIERARLRVQTRQWLLAKYRPKKYGVQPLAIETTGDDALSDLISQFRRRNEEIEDA